MTDWLSRYRSGRRDAVWHELRQLGSGVRERADEARAVCEEMARRARHNVELIVERLTAEGYRFHANNDEQTPATPHIPPTENAEAHLGWMRDRFGTLPMTLEAWVRIVGDVWLVGTHPRWPTSAGADPLVVEVERPCSSEGYRRYLEEEHEAWAQEPDGLFEFSVAPDQLHKDNTSGGSPYGFVLPDGCADGLFAWDGGPMPFVSYLNRVFGDGGFPNHTGTEGEWWIKHQLAQDLLPL
ncbi:hypothetical protein [Lentzea sp.]|uniref:hypothetical protein n=1 Tax=Lentzea sp. TaxID=56099 RepID=UPI002B5FF8FC|nr:hypothetical protein [Lentzea sp.]HUQ54257.1 hypothetical protein [Lentzea sp.]